MDCPVANQHFVLFELTLNLGIFELYEGHTLKTYKIKWNTENLPETLWWFSINI